MTTKSRKTQELKGIRDAVINLKESPLYAYRKENGYLPVIGEGNHETEIIFIGEAPGKNEAQQGRPFCGRAGKLLDELLLEIGIPREEVYITNILKDRPQENRDPLPEEIRLYGPFLDRQIEIIEPKVLVTLGRFAMEYIMRKYGLEEKLEPISKAHGKLYDASGLFGEIKIAVMYHPAAAIYNQNLIGVLKEDFQILKRFQ